MKQYTKKNHPLFFMTKAECMHFDVMPKLEANVLAKDTTNATLPAKHRKLHGFIFGVTSHFANFEPHRMQMYCDATNTRNT